MTGRTVRARPTVTFAVLALGVGAFALLQSLVIPVLTTVQHQLHTSQSAVTWVLTAYLLSASIMTPILGRVGDMTGKKRVFVATLIALAVGSLLAAVASSIAVMIVARVIQGFAGGMLPCAFGIIRDEFPAERVRGCGRDDRGADGRGGRARHRAGRAAGRRARLSLAVLAAADLYRGGGGGGDRVRARVGGADAGADFVAARGLAVRVAGGAAGRAERGSSAGAGGPDG